jgi:DNA-binding CsgD family transcriptional regulator
MKGLNSHELLDTLPARVAYEMIVFQRALIQLSVRDDLEAFLRSVKVFIGNAPLILALFDRQGRNIDAINLGWSEEWIARYRQEGWAEVDPVMQQAVGVPIVWSEALSSARRGSKKLRAFLAACQAEGWDRGLTFIADRGDVRIVLSAQGADIERSSVARHVFEGILDGMVDVAHKLLTSDTQLSQLTAREAELIRLIALDGLTEKEAADAMGLSGSSVQKYINRLKKRFNARTPAHLVMRIMAPFQ